MAQFQQEQLQAEEGAVVSLKFTKSLGSSHKSESPQILADRLAVLAESLSLEMADLESARLSLATQAEVLAEIGSQVRDHISTLRKVSNQIEKIEGSVPQPSLYQTGLSTPVVGFAPLAAGPPGLAEAQQVAPPPWPGGQG